jgi:hypothetical protein
MRRDVRSAAARRECWRGDRVLNREIDADAADRRHGVRRIADAEQARPVPLAQPIDRDRQQLDCPSAISPTRSQTGTR